LSIRYGFVTFLDFGRGGKAWRRIILRRVRICWPLDQEEAHQGGGKISGGYYFPTGVVTRKYFGDARGGRNREKRGNQGNSREKSTFSAFAATGKNGGLEKSNSKALSSLSAAGEENERFRGGKTERAAEARRQKGEPATKESFLVGIGNVCPSRREKKEKRGRPKEKERGEEPFGNLVLSGGTDSLQKRDAGGKIRRLRGAPVLGQLAVRGSAPKREGGPWRNHPYYTVNDRFYGKGKQVFPKRSGGLEKVLFTVGQGKPDGKRRAERPALVNVERRALTFDRIGKTAKKNVSRRKKERKGLWERPVHRPCMQDSVPRKGKKLQDAGGGNDACRNFGAVQRAEMSLSKTTSTGGELFWPRGGKGNTAGKVLWVPSGGERGISSRGCRVIGWGIR